MAWLQENWIIAVVGLVVAVVLLWWLFGRSKPEAVAPTIVEPAKPAKPLEPAKPEIIAAEPARFKPLEPKPRPVAPTAPPPAPEPAAKALPPEPTSAPEAAPLVKPVAEAARPAPSRPATKPKAAPKPAMKKAATREPAAKPTAKPAAKKVAAKPAPAETAAVPEEPTAAPAAKPAPAATTAKADNLQLLKGVGPKLVVLLNGLGVASFRQIADWTDADIARIDPQLGAFQGRIARDNLVDQAGYLARGDKAGFEAKYGALGGEL
ncbi:MAG: hypothetical protein J7499_03965 [Sphingopyxis sp.]|nr:hypothetical protein [Sphingopyxis sp.]